MSDPPPPRSSLGKLFAGGPGGRTVETHLTHAYRKLDISSRAQITAALDVEHDQFTHKARAADLRSTRSGD